MLDKYSQLTTLSSSWWTPSGQAYGVMREPPEGCRRYVSYITDSRAEAAAAAAEGSGDEQTPQSTKNSDRKAARANTKQVIRKRWESFRKQLDAMLQQVHGSDSKCAMADILRLIFEASLLEPMVENPGETFMSTINSDLTELQRVYLRSHVCLSLC